MVEFESSSYLRGLTFDNSILIVDESENHNFHELDTIYTRLGDNSKIVFCGDYRQSDFKQKYENDLALAKIPSHGMILTERTFMDVYAYAQSWTWKFVDEGIDFEVGSRWLSAYSRKCMSAQMECYAGTILLPLMDHVVFENDPHRAKKEDAARVYEEVASVAQRLKFSGHQSFVLSAKSIHDRADQVEGYLKLVKKND